MQTKWLYSYALSLFIAFALVAGCAGSTEKTPRLESGVTNPQYQGVAAPVVPKQFKLSADEVNNGIKKEPIKSKTGQVLTPEIQVLDIPSQSNEQENGTQEAAKPQV